MKHKKLKYYQKWNMLVVGGTALLFTTVFFLSSFFINRVNADNLSDVVYGMKQSFIHDSVNNEMRQVDQYRQLLEEQYQNKVLSAKAELDAFYEEDADNLIHTATDFFNDLRRNHFYVYIYDSVLNSTVYSKAWIDSHQGIPHTIYTFPTFESDIDHYYLTMQSDFLAYQDLTYGKYRIFVGVPHYYIEKKVADFFRLNIYDMQFDDQNTYMWVNKIIDPTGGDNYAIRVIHPNLRATEYVTPLSTNMLDYSGATTPYLTELNGVLDEDGEVYFTYTFKLLASDAVGTKLTYSKLYEPYDWIIAMGIYVEDINPFIAEARTQSIITTAILVGTFLLTSLGLFSVHYLLIQRLQARLLVLETQSLHDEISHDGLTGTRSRKAAVVDLTHYFNLYKQTGESVTLMLYDFDHFKHINDNYGHDVGDLILTGVSKAIKDSLRTTDHLYRLGGDEFVVVYFGLKEENTQKIADNLIRIAQSYQCECPENESIHPSISIGVTRFSKADQQYQDALKRADKALYVAKKTKKGTAFIDFEENDTLKT